MKKYNLHFSGTVQVEAESIEHAQQLVTNEMIVSNMEYNGYDEI